MYSLTRATVYILGSLVGTVLPSSPSVKWEEQNKVLTVSSDIKKAFTLCYTFKNSGKSDISIESAVSSCGCTSVVFETNEVHPHSKGFLKLVHEASADTGVETVDAMVRFTSSGGTLYQKVTAKIKYRPDLLLSEAFLNWKVRSPRKAYWVQLDPINKKIMKNLSVHSGSSNIKADIVMTAEKNPYLVVSVLSTTYPTSSIILLEFFDADGREHSLFLPVSIS